MVERDYSLPPGGISPIECDYCGRVILSESEGDPVMIQGPCPRCVHYDRCKKLLGAETLQNNRGVCDFAPSRFKEA